MCGCCFFWHDSHHAHCFSIQIGISWSSTFDRWSCVLVWCSTVLHQTQIVCAKNNLFAFVMEVKWISVKFYFYWLPIKLTNLLNFNKMPWIRNEHFSIVSDRCRFSDCDIQKWLVNLITKWLKIKYSKAYRKDHYCNFFSHQQQTKSHCKL